MAVKPFVFVSEGRAGRGPFMYTPFPVPRCFILCGRSLRIRSINTRRPAGRRRCDMFDDSQYFRLILDVYTLCHHFLHMRIYVYTYQSVSQQSPHIPLKSTDLVENKGLEKQHRRQSCRECRPVIER